LEFFVKQLNGIRIVGLIYSITLNNGNMDMQTYNWAMFPENKKNKGTSGEITPPNAIEEGEKTRSENISRHENDESTQHADDKEWKKPMAGEE
jgi:hypothetical protein